MDNTCVCCGAEIPEGRQVCKACEEGFTARNQETLRKLREIAEKIGSALIESVEAAKEALLEILAPFMDAVKELARRFGELIAQDIQPKTIPPRSPIRCIGCRPETMNRKPTVIRRGCRHK